ncbi:sodium:proton antiporter [Companilactobacillus suantsaicola]|uniref:Sodium:proton antiporter n=1 Tax=Companilactobacillus suantsaicola TaxID=2487723 RepID=A0A4Z0JLG7_9LACO|nr:sodium:proton antiporter [Companilactobacillus suantsaicola]TGD22964.1 sodium:proton antiporter [Companilactobacillus suantsaicola]
MNLMISTFVLILAAVISILLAQAFQKISVSYISMFLGAMIALIPLSNYIEHFNSEIFLGLIIAPLLFFEGQATQLRVVGQEIKHIIQTAVFLVLLCMIFAEFSVHLFAGISLPLAFILAAVSTPTDATAMESVTNGLKVPKEEGTFLKMESLFNDASGIILLNMAALWYANGYVNYTETLRDFLISAVGGVVFGFLSAFIIVLFRQVIIRSSFNSLNAQNILYIVTPLVIYFLAEKIHVSGIIAVVCAGLVHNAEAQRSKLTNAPQVHQGMGLVSLITETFNSTVFVILGYMFVKIIIDDKITSQSLNWVWIGIILYVINVAARYLYSRIRLRFNNRAGWIFSLGGVHGAVTLALAYTLAESSVRVGDFNLVLMSESFLIILSLIVPTIVFQFILPKEVDNQSAAKEIDELRVEMVHRAIDAVNKMYLPDNVRKSVIFDLMSQKQRTRTRDFARAWLEVVKRPEFTGAEKELEMRAFMNALAKEREYLDMVSQSEVKYQNYVYDLYNEVLLAESLVIGPDIFDENAK